MAGYSYDKMKKQFFRVKQLADQTVGRAEKTEVLTEDLMTTEKRVKLLEQTCSSTHKRVAHSLHHHQSSEKDIEKRLKKLPESLLASQLHDNSAILGDGLGLLATVYQLCAEGFYCLGKQHLEYEIEVENNVLTPLNEFLEVDFPNIAKLKKQLNKLTLDMDAVKSRYQSAQKQLETQVASGTATPINLSAQQAKVDQIKQEQNEAAARVEQCKDQLASELYKMCSRQDEFARLLVKIIEIQREYHQLALLNLEDLMPKLKHWETMFLQKPVYGVALSEHLKATNREIAEVIEDCVCAILDTGLKEEGLFRIAGSAARMKKLRAEFDCGSPDLTEYDVHCIASALKLYLRELPDPLLTHKLYNSWMAANKIENEKKRLEALYKLCESLPKPNYNNFRYLIKFLAKLAALSDTNKMTTSNIAIVFGPNLIYSENDNGMNVFTSGQQSNIIETFVSHADYFFPGELEYKHYSPKEKPRFAHQNISEGNTPPSEDVTSKTNVTREIPSSMSALAQSIGVIGKRITAPLAQHDEDDDDLPTDSKKPSDRPDYIQSTCEADSVTKVEDPALPPSPSPKYKPLYPKLDDIVYEKSSLTGQHKAASQPSKATSGIEPPPRPSHLPQKPVAPKIPPRPSRHLTRSMEDIAADSEMLPAGERRNSKVDEHGFGPGIIAMAIDPVDNERDRPSEKAVNQCQLDEAMDFKITPDSDRQMRMIPGTSDVNENRSRTLQDAADTADSSAQAVSPIALKKVRKPAPRIPDRPSAVPERQDKANSLDRAISNSEKWSSACLEKSKSSSLERRKRTSPDVPLSATQQRPLLVGADASRQDPQQQLNDPSASCSHPDLISFLDQKVPLPEKPPIPERLSLSERPALPPPSSSFDK